MKYKKSLIILVLALPILFVVYVMNSDTTKIRIPNNKMYSALLSKLKDDKIPFEVNKDHVFKIKKTDKEKFTKLYGETFNELMPVERTFSLLANMQPKVEEALISNKFSYEKICFRNLEHIILGKDNYKKAQSLVDKTIEEAIENLTLEASLKGKKLNTSEFTKCNQNS